MIQYNRVIFTCLILCSTNYSFGKFFDSKEINRRIDDLVSKVKVKIEDDYHLVQTADAIRKHNRNCKNKGPGCERKLTNEEWQRIAEAEERIRVRNAHKDSCLNDWPTDKLEDDIKSRCKADEAYRICEAAVTKAQQGKKILEEKRALIEADESKSAKALANAESNWDDMAKQANLVHDSFKECEKFVVDSVFSDNCLTVYDSFFNDPGVVKLIVNTCQPGSVKQTVHNILSILDRGDRGDSIAKNASRAKKLHDEAFQEGIALAEALYKSYMWLVKEFPETFGRSTAKVK